MGGRRGKGGKMRKRVHERENNGNRGKKGAGKEEIKKQRRGREKRKGTETLKREKALI